MGYEKNHHNWKKTKAIKKERRSGAYKPRIPFHTIEGIGTEAWNRLDMGAIGLLTEFYKKFNGYNRWNLSLPYREVKHKMASLIFTRWQWQLIGFGFIEVVRWGRLERNCSLYALSNRWRKLSKEPGKLDEIESLLKEIEIMKREKGNLKKRMKIEELRKRILRIGNK